MANKTGCIFLKISKFFLFGMSKPALGMLAITCIGLLNANAIAEQSNNTQNIDAYCEQLTQAQRNTMEAVYDGDCTNGFYKLMYGVERLKLSLKDNKEYDLTPICEFNEPFTSIYISGLKNPLPNCFSKLKKLRSIDIYTATEFDLTIASEIESLQYMALRLVDDIEGTLDSNTLETLRIISSNISPSVDFISQESLVSLTLTNVNLKNLDAFQGFSNLHSLVISSMEELADMNALAGFHQLEDLFIANIYHPYDFPMLNNHSKLETIKIKWGHFEHIDKLRYLPNLKFLTIDETDPAVTDISVLSHLKTLEKVSLYGQNISDVTPLAALPKLEAIVLRGGNDYMNDVTRYFEIAQHEAPISIDTSKFLSCSPQSLDEYQKGKRCNEQQRQKCGKKAPGLSRKFCVWWNRD